MKSLLTLNRWFALIRIWSPWLAPRQGKTQFGLDKEAVMCSFLGLNGKHLVLLAITGVDSVMTMFTSDSEGNVVLRVCSDYAEIILLLILDIRSEMIAQQMKYHESWLALVMTSNLPTPL